MTLLFRADGSPTVGWGHLMRCLTLALAWKSNGGSLFLCGACPSGFREHLLAGNIPWHEGEFEIGSAYDAAAVISLARTHQITTVLLDGYHFGAEYQTLLRQSGLKVAIVDDQPICPFYDCDLLVNPSVIAAKYTYHWRDPAPSNVLLGTDYALVRPDVVSCRQEHAFREGPQNIVISLGATSQLPAHELIANALSMVPESVQSLTVLTSEEPAAEIWSGFAKTHGKPVRAVWLREGLAKLFESHGLAICAGGTICWELAFNGIPSVAVAVNESQLDILEALNGRSLLFAGHIASPHTTESLAEGVASVTKSGSQWSELSTGGRKLVDGRGAQRICDHLKLLN